MLFAPGFFSEARSYRGGQGTPLRRVGSPFSITDPAHTNRPYHQPGLHGQDPRAAPPDGRVSHLA